MRHRLSGTLCSADHVLLDVFGSFLKFASLVLNLFMTGYSALRPRLANSFWICLLDLSHLVLEMMHVDVTSSLT